jgi:N4-(beta-N-acetylglucosaminyl)-L-asparaginase
VTTRRRFLKASAAAGVGAALGTRGTEAWIPEAPAVVRRRVGPVAVASGNGRPAVAETMRALAEGRELVDAVVAGVSLVERDPSDMSVGYGGLPNYEGVVQLDASVMCGRTRDAGAVGALEGIMTPSEVALRVMRHTRHIFLVGEGAQRFARSMGFETRDLLTDEARERWLEWRHSLSAGDDFLPFEQVPPRPDRRPPLPDADELGMLDSFDGVRPWGTINCCATDGNGNLAGVTTTSGLAFKLPGRVGDSPIVGAGLYVDNDVGACGSTGRGESVIITCGSHTVVELMRGGMSPTDAALEALRRIVRFTVQDHLLNEQGQPSFNVNYYVVNRAGELGGAAIWSGARHVVNVDGETEVRDSAYLFERT